MVVRGKGRGQPFLCQDTYHVGATEQGTGRMIERVPDSRSQLQLPGFNKKNQGPVSAISGFKLRGCVNRRPPPHGLEPPIDAGDAARQEKPKMMMASPPLLM